MALVLRLSFLWLPATTFRRLPSPMPQLHPFPRYYHLPPGRVAGQLPVTRHGIRALDPFPFVPTQGPVFAQLEVTPLDGSAPAVRGLCGLLPARAFTDGYVRPHENTLASRLTRQRQLVLGDHGALGKPVLLASDTAISPTLLPPVPEEATAVVYDCGGYRYRLVDLPAPAIPLILPDTLVIADGHHRAYTHAILAAEGHPRFGHIPVVIVAGEQLRIGAFQRLIDPAGHPNLPKLLAALAPYFTAERLPAPTPVTRRGDWLLTYRGECVRLRRRDAQVRGTDPGWLTEVVLPAVFGIDDLRTDPRIASIEPPPLTATGTYDLSGMPDDRISLLGYPIDHARFFTEVAAGRLFPPKSTRFTPRIPSGLLVWLPD